MSKSMYQINQEQQQIIDLVEMLDGELTPEIEQHLTINKQEMESKSIAYLSVLSNGEAQNRMIDTEIKRLQALKKRNSRMIDTLKETLLTTVKNFGVFTVGLTKFGTRKSTSVEVEDVNEVPDKYRVVIVSARADKAEIKEAILRGEKIKGAYLKHNINLKIN